MKEKPLKWTKEEMNKTSKLIEEYLVILRLDNWKVITYFLNKGVDIDEEGQRCAAEIKTNTTYLQSDLTLYNTSLEIWRDIGIESFKKVLKHELCHILTEELYLCGYNRFIEEREVNHAREKLTEHISKLIC